MESLTRVTDVTDPVDLAIVHALDIDGRAPFARVAQVLGVSDATVARRYHRLRTDGVCRVVGLRDVRRTGNPTWVVRLRCTPDAGQEVAAALARRTDTAWVRLCSGGTELVCVTRPRSREDHNTLLTRQLARTARVVDVSAQALLRIMGHGACGWRGQDSPLTADQLNALSAAAPHPDPDTPLPAPVDGDEALYAALAVDGRTSCADLARVCGWSESSTRRRLELLRTSGVLLVECESDPARLGQEVEATLWLTVAPAHLVAVAQAVAGHPEVAFAAVTTGRTNIMVSLVCRDLTGMYEYLETRLAPLEGIQAAETSPILRTFKREAVPRLASARGGRPAARVAATGRHR